MEICDCPGAPALTTILRPTCKQNLGQLQRFLFQRPGFVFDANAVDPAEPNPIALLASWTPLFAANDDTKVVSSPYVENFVIPRAERITEGGGDNTTIDGREIHLGWGAISALGQVAEVPGNIIKSIKKLMCEADLVVYPINQYGQIIGIDAVGLPESGAPSGSVAGIPISSFFVSDLDNNGINTRDKGDFGFSLDFGWRDDLVMIKPTDFNAKTALWPAP
jgi:hypothetical protein